MHRRRSRSILVGAVVALVGAVVPGGAAAGTGPTGPVGPVPAAAPADASPAAAIVAAHVPKGAPGEGDVAVLDVDAQAVLVVTTTADGGAGSLREAIETLAVSEGGDTVVLAAGATYVLTCAAGGGLEHGDTPLEIEGNGARITMEAGCEEGILDNGTGALVIRDVDVTGLDLRPTGAVTAIVETGGPLTLVGGLVADNTVDSGDHPLDGFFFKRPDAPGAVVVEGTVFARNTRRVGADCGLLCVVGDLSVRGAVFTDTAVTTTSGCGLVCITGDAELVDTSVTTTTNRGTSHCGGIVCMDGDLALVRSTITGTTSAVDAPGTVCGGIACTTGDLRLTDSSVTGTTVTDAAADLCGAVLCTANAELVLVRSTLATTTATLSGGGDGNRCAVMVCGVDRIRAVNSTVADNVTTGGARLRAAFAAGAAVDLVYVTFVGNSGSGLPAIAPATGGPVPLTTFGSVLARSGAGGTCAPGLTATSHGYGWADDTSCGLTGPGDRQSLGGDPRLGALADHGGPGPTMLPTRPSPLVDAIPAAACRAGAAAGITTDERGEPRPAVPGTACDIGAVELGPAPAVPEPTFTG